VTPVHTERRAWHRSLYGRIALGYFVLMVLVLVAQGAMFLWLAERSAQSPMGETRVISAELSAALAANPHLDLGQFTANARPGEDVFVVMKDGRVSGRRLPSQLIISTALEDMKWAPAGTLPMTWEIGALRAVPVTVHGQTVGTLGIVPPSTLERFGPMIAAIDLSLLAAGALIAATLIFSPVRRRILELTGAAERLGTGDFAARARDTGSDEVAELARTFNVMANELAVRQQALDASNRARKQLLADVSHELMTPLTAVLGLLETLTMKEVRLDDEQRLRHAVVARREAQRLERLVGDLLDAARLEAGGGELLLQDLEVAALFEQVIAHHEHEARARGVTMRAAVEPEGLRVRGDEFRLEQAIENITANALRHTPDGGTIQLHASRSGGRVVLAVTDTGEGIPPGDLPLIFERFYKANASRTSGEKGGSGLGLSIVKAIVERHGGTVGASSTVGQGTTIRLELPVG
jgi:signal transduction histidine kinase